MSITLKKYQENSVGALREYLDLADQVGASDAFTAKVQEGLRNQYIPLRKREDVPYVCLRFPTGGGKTIMGAHIIKTANSTYARKDYPFVVWLVPSTTIKEQTLE